jgi:hypothetical protein
MNEEFFEKSYLTRSTLKNPQRKRITQLVPKFDWDKFVRLPNAANFVEKQYYQLITQMMREIDEQKNGTTTDHLNSMESIIARSIMFTVRDIEDWCDQQDWERAGIPKVRANKIKAYLSEFGMRKGGVNAECSMPAEIREKLAQRVAQIAKKNDPLAEWMFTRLTAQRTEDDLLCDI